MVLIGIGGAIDWLWILNGITHELKTHFGRALLLTLGRVTNVWTVMGAGSPWWLRYPLMLILLSVVAAGFFFDRRLQSLHATIQCWLVPKPFNRLSARLKARGLHSDDASLGTVDVPQRVVFDILAAAFSNRRISIFASDSEPEITLGTKPTGTTVDANLGCVARR